MGYETLWAHHRQQKPSFHTKHSKSWSWDFSCKTNMWNPRLSKPTWCTLWNNQVALTLCTWRTSMSILKKFCFIVQSFLKLSVLLPLFPLIRLSAQSQELETRGLVPPQSAIIQKTNYECWSLFWHHTVTVWLILYFNATWHVASCQSPDTHEKRTKDGEKILPKHSVLETLMLHPCWNVFPFVTPELVFDIKLTEEDTI